MYAIIVFVIIGISAILFSIFTAKKDPEEEKLNEPKEKGKVVRLDEFDLESFHQKEWDKN